MAITKVEASLDDKTTELNNTGSEYTGDMTSPTVSGTYDLSVSAYDDKGNMAIMRNFLSVTNGTTPKTDWKSTDRFNIEDYNRIKNNLNYLHEQAVALWRSFDIDDMGEDMTDRTQYWDVDVFNMFETNLDAINQNILSKDYGVAQRFFNNGQFIKWDELNRIESATLDMMNILERQKAGLRRIAFKLGQFKEVRI